MRSKAYKDGHITQDISKAFSTNLFVDRTENPTPIIVLNAVNVHPKAVNNVHIENLEKDQSPVIN